MPNVPASGLSRIEVSLRSAFFLLVLCCAVLGVTGQGTQQNTKLNYRPPSNINGLTQVSVGFSYKFINTLGTIQLIYDAKCTGNLIYQYKGREFTFSDLEIAIRKVRAFDPVISMVVTGPDGFKKEMRVLVTSGLGGSVFGNSSEIKTAKTTAEKEPDNYRITSMRVVSVSYDNAWDVQDQLDKKLKQEKYLVDINEFLRKGDQAMQLNNHAEAESNYYKVIALDKNNQRAISQLKTIKTTVAKKDAKKRYDDLMKEARAAENGGFYDTAEKLYSEAGTVGQNDEYAKNEASRIETLKEKNRKDAATRAGKLAEDAYKEQSALNDVKHKTETETRKGIAEMDKAAKARLEEKMDRIAEELDAAERERYNEERRRKMEEAEIEEKKREEREAESNRQMARLRRADDRERIERIEAFMEYDPIKYEKELSTAERLLKSALQVNPTGELQLKKEWWDYGTFTADVADELYEQQRRDNHWRYMEKKRAETSAFHTAKNAYIGAMMHTDKGSHESKYLINKIEFINKQLDYADVTYKMDFNSEGIRIKARERARMMAQTDAVIGNRIKAELAYTALDQNASFPAQNLTKKYDLAQRMNKADEKKQQDQIVTGATQAIAIGVMTDDSKTVAVVKNSFALNAYASFGYESVPMLMNFTSDANTPTTVTKDLGVVPAYFGLDTWLYRSDHLDANIGGYLGLGMLPIKGGSSFLFTGGGKVNLDFGVKRFKIATTAEFLTRSGSQKEDNDVLMSETGSSTGNNTKGEGKISYSVVRIGGGFKINLSDDTEASHIWYNVFAEKPSFYKESITKNPIFSHQIEFLAKSGLMIKIAFAKNYVIAGEKKYSLPEQKNLSYLQFQFGKCWTILK